MCVCVDESGSDTFNTSNFALLWPTLYWGSLSVTLWLGLGADEWYAWTGPPLLVYGLEMQWKKTLSYYYRCLSLNTIIAQPLQPLLDSRHKTIFSFLSHLAKRLISHSTLLSISPIFTLISFYSFLICEPQREPQRENDNKKRINRA